MKTALVIIVITMMMLVGCTCIQPQAAPPAPEQPIPNVVPHTTQPTAMNVPGQSWESQHPDTTPDTNNVVDYNDIFNPPTQTYPSTPFYGGYWYYTPPYVPPTPKPVYNFWTGNIEVEVTNE